jgi:hypothetical protein
LSLGFQHEELDKTGLVIQQHRQTEPKNWRALKPPTTVVKRQPIKRNPYRNLQLPETERIDFEQHFHYHFAKGARELGLPFGASVRRMPNEREPQ